MSYYLYDDDYTPRWVLKLFANAHGGGGSSPPQLQTPTVSTNYAQNEVNNPTANANQAASMVNQGNWLGGLNYQQTGVGPDGTPLYTSSLSLSPAQQSLYNTLTGTQQTAGNQGQSLIQGANYGAQNPSTVIGDATSGLTGQSMNMWLQSQQSWMTDQKNQLDTKLRNQGLGPSPTATADPSTWGPYEQQMGQLAQSQQMGVSGAASQFLPQAFQQAEYQYMLPANLGMQLAQFGQYTSPGQALVAAPGRSAQPVDALGAINSYNQQQMNAYQAQQAENGQMIAALIGAGGNIAGRAITGSDRRLKTDIELITALPNGLNVYSFKFIGEDEPQVGLMSDEVRMVRPEAVIVIDGYDYVDYAVALNPQPYELAMK